MSPYGRSNIVLIWLLFSLSYAQAQEADESRVHSDFRREGEELAVCKQFSFGNVASCGQTVATGQPIHLAFGSLAPQNGVGLGLAFVEHKDFQNEWRMTFNTDAVATKNGSWRAGAYLKAFKLSGGRIVVVQGPGKPMNGSFFKTAPLFNVYAETTSLNTIYYYGLGPNTTLSGQSVFGMTETIGGASAILPLGRYGVSFFGELNGRVPRVRPAPHQTAPSLETVYAEATAPGLQTNKGFLEPGVGMRIQPELFKQHLRLHYMTEFQEYDSVGDSRYSFRRWTTDLGHEFPFDKKVHLTPANAQNGPDSCSIGPSISSCPSSTHISSAINHEGSVSVRLLMSGSVANAGRSVPFYFDPTLGGSDINGTPALASFDDYRFRAPNIVLLRETIEHAVPKVPLGVYFSADQGKVALRRNDINFDNLRQTYTAGITVHAGGLPVVYLLFSWGGGEGHHETFNVSNVLLGGSARPSLF